MAGNLVELRQEIEAGADAATELLARKVAARLHVLHAKQLGGRSHCRCGFCSALREYVGLKCARGRTLRAFRLWNHAATPHVLGRDVMMARSRMLAAEHELIRSA